MFYTKLAAIRENLEMNSFTVLELLLLWMLFLSVPATYLWNYGTAILER